MSQVDDIKSRLDIVDIISEYIQLKPAGTSFKALCPFHNEKTPSFMASRERQRWHCFGCGEGGDMFSFVMKMENVDFPDALKMLANKAGIVLVREDPKVAGEKDIQYQIIDLTAKFWHKILQSSQVAQTARQYLSNRRIDDDIIEEFSIGYAPDSWDETSVFLKKKGFKDEDIFLSGLTVKKEKGSGFYDRFRNRVIFPIFDAHGTVVAFGGRILPNDDPKLAKYINSPQTHIYNKSRTVYNFSKAKPFIKQQDMAVLVEGYMDVIASWKAGVKNVVASSGTALTHEHVKTIARYTKNLALAFDADTAGETASIRGVDVALGSDVELKVIAIPYGKDPDECVQHNPKAWSQAVALSRPFMDYVFERALQKHSPHEAEGKKNLANAILSFLGKMHNAIQRSHWLSKLASVINVPEEILREQLTRIQKIKSTPEQNQPRSTTASIHKSRELQLEEMLVACALKFTEHFGYIVDHCQPEFLEDKTLLDLYKALIVYYTKNVDISSEENFFDYNRFFSFVSSEYPENTPVLKQRAETLMLLAENDFQLLDPLRLKEEIQTIVYHLHETHLKRQIHTIKLKLEEAEKTGDEENIRKFSKAFSQTMEELNVLRDR